MEISLLAATGQADDARTDHAGGKIRVYWWKHHDFLVDLPGRIQ
jgi:hypothetical protein